MLADLRVVFQFCLKKTCVSSKLIYLHTICTISPFPVKFASMPMKNQVQQLEVSVVSAWNILSKVLADWFESTVKVLPSLVVATLLFCLFIIFARLIQNVVGRVLGRLIENRAVTKLMQSVAYFIVMFIGLFTCLGVLELDKTVTSLLAGAGVVGLAISLAFQEIASNFLAGILIAFRKPYRIGDIVQVDGTEGEVHEIFLRTTSLVTYQGLEVIIPNKDMFNQKLINYTSTPIRRVDLDVGISYGEDLEHVENIVTAAIQKIANLVQTRQVCFVYTGFGDSSIDFQIQFWITSARQAEFQAAKHQAIKLIKKAFDQEGIVIPFPIRTLDFGIKGGQKLEESLRDPRAN